MKGEAVDVTDDPTKKSATLPSSDRALIEFLQTYDIVLEMINSFWAEKYDNLYDALIQNQSYAVSKGPKGLDFRYITEDVPFGICPIVKLGRKYGIAMPYLETLIQMYSLVLEQDMMAQAPAVDQMDLQALLA